MNNKNTTKYQSTVLVPPGETVLEVLESKGITQAELAKRIDRPLKTINGIIKGKVSITPETSLQLENALDIPASFWNNLESQFQELKLRIESQRQYEDLIPQSKIYPYLEMVKNGWIENTKNLSKRVEYLLKFFGVTNFDNIVEEAKLQSAFRIYKTHKHDIPAITSWLRKGSIDGSSIITDPFDSKKVKELVPKLRELTLIQNPNELMPKLEEEFKKCGISFVLTKSLRNAPICGATRWIGPEKALIQMSIRLSWSDIFWFSLFHELGHIIQDNKKDFNVDLVKKNVDDASELEKDEFAKESLIPKEKYEILLAKIKEHNAQNNPYSLVEAFSKNITIHPGIVIGRLQHDKIIGNNMNRLRVRYSWVK